MKVPDVIDTYQSENTALLILEHIESGKKQSGFWDHFAKGLAQLHKNSAGSFGWSMITILAHFTSQIKNMTAGMIFSEPKGLKNK